MDKNVCFFADGTMEFDCFSFVLEKITGEIMFTCNFCGVFCTDHGQLPQNIDVLGQTTTFQDVC